MTWFRDLTSKKFGRLTVLYKTPSRSWGSVLWRCKCECGKLVTINGASLRYGRTLSCGCFMREVCGLANSNPNAARNKIWGAYKSRAITMHMKFSLTSKKFDELIFGNCHYCGALPSRESVSFAGNKVLYNGIDRINPRIGYTAYNSITCCTTCNMMKKAHSYEFFIAHIKRIALQMRLHGKL